MLKPDDIVARMTRATQSLDAGRFDAAFLDISAIIGHPGLAEYLRKEAVLLTQVRQPSDRSLIGFLQAASRRYYSRGKIGECRKIGRCALDLAIASNMHTADSHYNLARAFVVSDRIVATDAGAAAKHLYCAFVAHPLYKQKYAQDATFNAVRVQLDAILDSMPDPDAEYHRNLTAMSSPKGR